MKTFGELPVKSFFRLTQSDSPVRYKLSHGRNEINCVNILLGVLSNVDTDANVIEMEPCEGGFREKKLTFKDLKPGNRFTLVNSSNTEYRKIKSPEHDRFNAITDDYTLVNITREALVEAR